MGIIIADKIDLKVKSIISVRGSLHNDKKFHISNFTTQNVYGKITDHGGWFWDILLGNW